MNTFATIFSTMTETFRLQRRDRIFLPAAVVGLCVLLFAHVASNWGVENYMEILFNVATTGFHVTGAIVALLWGSKLLADSRSDGSIEVQLAAPVSRASWLIGKYLGLAASLLLLAIILVGAWQLLYFANEFGLVREVDLYVFGLIALEWLLIGAIAFLFASFSGSAVTLFATFCLWIVGLSSSVVANLLPAETTPVIRGMIEWLAQYWNLQNFHITSAVLSGEVPQQGEILARFGYGLFLVLICISLASIIFSRRSIIQ